MLCLQILMTIIIIITIIFMIVFIWWLLGFLLSSINIIFITFIILFNGLTTNRTKKNKQTKPIGMLHWIIMSCCECFLSFFLPPSFLIQAVHLIATCRGKKCSLCDAFNCVFIDFLSCSVRRDSFVTLLLTNFSIVKHTRTQTKLVADWIVNTAYKLHRCVVITNAECFGIHARFCFCICCRSGWSVFVRSFYSDSNTIPWRVA